MELYLMQHGMAFKKEQDPEERLNPEGRARILKSAQAMKKMGIQVDVILCSPKERSRETAGIVAEALEVSPGEIVETERVKPKAPPEDTLDLLKSYLDRKAVFVSGHLPSLNRLASHLLTGGEAQVGIGIQNGGLVRIDIDSASPESGSLTWCLPPLVLSWVLGNE